jgi:hypothetical protein
MTEYIMVKAEDDDDKEDKAKQAVAGFGCGILLLAIAFVVAPDCVPFDLFQFWFLDIEFGALMRAMFPLFAWGIILSLFMMALKADRPDRRLPGGAALLSSNGRFRDGHLYQGTIGWIDAWFCGMILFYIMFKWGLFAAIIVHFFYDFFLFTMLAMIIYARDPRR